MFKFRLAIAGTLVLATPAMAQSSLSAGQSRFAPDYPATTGSIDGITQNNTGGEAEPVISRGPTGADTVTDNSAAGGNAQRPELAVPNGSAGGGGR